MRRRKLRALHASVTIIGYHRGVADPDPTLPNSRPIRWASRISPQLIRRLYEADARHIPDDALIDEVGCTLLARCEAIRICSERLCPFCAGELLGERNGESILTCAGCGQRIRWRTYQNSYKKRRIHGPRALPAFMEFLHAFPKAKTWSEKMRAIDAVIHAVHETLRPNANPWIAPAAENLIEGSAAETFALLESLAGNSPDRLRWRARVAPYAKRLRSP